MAAVIGDRAEYVVTVRRIDGNHQWVYPPYRTEASSVRGALTKAALAPLDRWHELTEDEE